MKFQAGNEPSGKRCPIATRCALLLSLIALTSCSGGSDGPPGTSNPPPNPPASPPPPDPAPPDPAPSYSARISWIAPDRRQDGSPIDNLTGFRVYHGTSYLDLPQTRTEISNPSAITSTVTGLTAGTWYFAVTAVDGSGFESSFSNIVALTFP